MNKYIYQELKYGAKNYKSIGICIKKAKGIYLTDIYDNKYIDFISSYSAVNQGHCHSRLTNTIIEQSSKLTLTSRAYHNNILGPYMNFITDLFKYDKILPMNTGVEAGETAIKIARKWGYNYKNVPENKAEIIFPTNNFWGRTITACSTSTNISCYNQFGPFTDGFDIVPYNNIEKLEDKFLKNPNIVAYMLEPIQGEAGIIIPYNGYLRDVKYLCEKYNILMIADEVQTGLGRTGKLLACDYEDVKPDILCLGKALSGGYMPISAVLANNNIMKYITPGTHGSTFGGNPLACSIAIEALKIINDEKLVENSYNMGEYFRKELKNIKNNNIIDIRGKGLLNAIELKNKIIANKFCNNLIENGLLTSITHGNIIRLSPPLIININEINKSLDIILKSLKYI